MPTSPDAFLETLQAQAQQQAQLHQRKLLPKQVEGFTALVGSYPWQILLFLSGLTALLFEVLK